MVANFFVFGNRLVVPGNDPKESWAYGNLYIKGRRWQKIRTIPHGLHCFKLAYVKKRLYAVVSTERGAKLLESGDWGKTWTAIPAYGIPNVIFSYRDTLSGLDRWDTFYEFTDGLLPGRPMVPRLRQLTAPTYLGGSRPFSYGKALAFGKSVVLLPSFGSVDPAYPPSGLRCLVEPSEKPRSVPFFSGQWIADAIVRGKTLYVLCTKPAGTTYQNTVYMTRDLETWRCTVSFTTATFARSFEEARGSFYVSLGCNRPKAKEKLPVATGDVLRVTPIAMKF